MKLECTECGTPIVSQDIDLPTKMAKCRACNAVFSFADRVLPAAMEQRPRIRAPRPEGLEVRETFFEPNEPGYRDAPRSRGTVTIVRRWFAPQFIFLLFFCIAWDAFLVFWYTNATQGPGAFAWIAAIFPIAHVAVGVGLTYYTIAGFVNHTTIKLDEHNLSVRHAPLPWKGNHTLAREEIRQLYCEHQVSEGKNGPSHSYHLSAVLADGRKVRLAAMPVEQGKYIEELLEDKLGIENMAVPGEVG